MKAKVLELMNKLFAGKDLEKIVGAIMVPYTVERVKDILAGKVEFTSMDVIMLTSAVGTFDTVNMTITISGEDSLIIKELREFIKTDGISDHLKPIV